MPYAWSLSPFFKKWRTCTRSYFDWIHMTGQGLLFSLREKWQRRHFDEKMRWQRLLSYRKIKGSWFHIGKSWAYVETKKATPLYRPFSDGNKKIQWYRGGGTSFHIPNSMILNLVGELNVDVENELIQWSWRAVIDWSACEPNKLDWCP